MRFTRNFSSAFAAWRSTSHASSAISIPRLSIASPRCSSGSKCCQSHGMLDLEGGRLRIPADRLTISNEVFLELLG